MRRGAIVFALAFVACGGEEVTNPAPIERGSWPQYGRDQANTRANLDETAITQDSVATLSERWHQTLPGCTSTPAIVDGIAYVGDWSGMVHAFSVEDGSARWSTQVVDKAIDPSPLVVDGMLYVGSGAGAFHALDVNSGAVKWTVQLDDHQDAHIFSSAAAADGMVFVGVAGIELVQNKPDYTFRGSLVALDAKTGAERWRVYMTEDDATSGAGVSVWSSVAIDSDRGWLFVGTGNTYEAPASQRADALVAIDYQSGDVQWVRQFTADDVYTIFQAPPQGPDADVGAAPNLFTADGRDMIAVGDKAGVVSALDRETGETVWAKQLTPGAHLGGVMNSAAYADGTLYVTSNNFTQGIGIDALDDPDPLNTHTTFALDAADGTIRWSVEQPYPSVGALSYGGGVVYHSSVDGTLHAMAAADGTELWSHLFGDSMASGASLVDGTLYVTYGFYFFLSSGDLAGGIAALSP
jgi:polyvinyl alcohol dehydrogenase (cytochrome)